jgi:Rod binding domain-containing protein
MQIGLVDGALSGADANRNHLRLVRAAQEFEAQMMEELLKPIGESFGEAGDDGGTGSGSLLGDFAAQSLGQALSRVGGFGIADRIVAGLSHSGPAIHGGKPASNLCPPRRMRTDE